MSSRLFPYSYDAIIVDENYDIANLVAQHLIIYFGFGRPFIYQSWPGMTAMTPLVPYVRVFVVDYLATEKSGPGEMPLLLGLSTPKVITSTSGFGGYHKFGYQNVRFLYKPFGLDYLHKTLVEMGLEFTKMPDVL